MPSQQRLRELFDYNDGALYPKRSTRGRRATAPIGGVNGRYLYACVDYAYKAVHRLIWVWHYGPIPPLLYVDHVDHNPFNNRIENLRLVTNAENGKNRRLSSNSPTQALGVRFRDGKWHASITLGTFDTFEEALAIRRAAEQLAGFHPNHGKEKPRRETVAELVA